MAASFYYVVHFILWMSTFVKLATSLLLVVDDVEEFLPLLVEVVVGGEALLDVHDALFHSGLAERAARYLHRSGAVGVDVHQTVAVVEGTAADFLQRDGEHDFGEAGAAVECVTADFQQ